MNMRYGVEWVRNDGSKSVWRRTSDVVFNLVSLDSLVTDSSQQGSASSVCSFSTVMSQKIGGLGDFEMGHKGASRAGCIGPEYGSNSISQYKVTLLGNENDPVNNTASVLFGDWGKKEKR